MKPGAAWSRFQTWSRRVVWRKQPPPAGWDRLVAALLLGWLATMVGLPIGRWVWGDGVLPAGASLGVVWQAGAVAAMLALVWSPRQLALALGVVVVFTWAVEAVGVTTGYPFGRYYYTALLQPQVRGVPLLIPLAWFMLLPPAWAAVEQPGYSSLRFAAVSALAFTAWDLFLDPQMVAWGFWQWEQPGGYFGIPWSNYGGWLLTSFTLTLILSRWLPLRPALARVRRPLFLIYSLTWFLESVGLALFWGLPGPALAGGLAMGLVVFFGRGIFQAATPE